MDEDGRAALHGGLRPSRPVRAWLGLVQWLAATAPLTRASPDALAVAGVVALRTGRARPLGAVVDATCDRIGDLLFVGVLAVAGAPLPWFAAVAVAVLLHEYVRARAQAAGMPGVGAVTVAERPTRVIVVAVVILGAGTLPGGTPWTGWSWAAVGVALWAVLSAVGLATPSAPGRPTAGAAAGPCCSATALHRPQRNHVPATPRSGSAGLASPTTEPWRDGCVTGTPPPSCCVRTAS
jgi:phosphatidylglycerophosphate synthase